MLTLRGLHLHESNIKDQFEPLTLKVTNIYTSRLLILIGWKVAHICLAVCLYLSIGTHIIESGIKGRLGSKRDSESSSRLGMFRPYALLGLVFLSLQEGEGCMRRPHLVEPLVPNTWESTSLEPAFTTPNPSVLPIPGDPQVKDFLRIFLPTRLSLVWGCSSFPSAKGGTRGQFGSPQQLTDQLELQAWSQFQCGRRSSLANLALDPWRPPLHLVGQHHQPVDLLQS